MSFLGCRKENFPTSQKKEETSIAKTISYRNLLTSLPSASLVKIEATSSQNSSTPILEQFDIDTLKILQTSNTKNEVFYSMGLIPKKGGSWKSFYNLYIKKDSLGKTSQQIIKYTPTIESIKNGYKNFKGEYEILQNAEKKSGQIKAMSDNTRPNSNPCMILTVEVECANGYVHYEGDGPGDWCQVGGSYHLYMLDCSGGGGSSSGIILNNPGTSLGNFASGFVLISPGISRVNFTSNYEVNLFISQLYYDNQTWADNNIDELNRLVAPLAEEPVDEEYKIFVATAINVMSTNNISWQLYENWFLGASDGKDGEYVDPDLIEYETPLTQDPLPTLSAWLSAFPKVSNTEQMTRDNVIALIGGSIESSANANPGNFSNACALRGSRGLLYSGISIPVLKYGNPPVQITQKGGDNKNYILSASSFDKFMRDKFGEANFVLAGADANDPVKVAAFLKGKNGIYVIVNALPGVATYSGHVDAIINGRCVSNAYTLPKGGVKSIRIWTLN